jgi:hypothetical protein
MIRKNGKISIIAGLLVILIIPVIYARIRTAGENEDSTAKNQVTFYASLPDHLTIEHNEVRNLTYSGISVGWSWRKEQTPHSDGEISYNKVHDVCLTNPDGGGIYILGTVSGNGARIHHNYTFNVKSPNGWAASWAMAGLYTDGPGATNVLLDSNVINNCMSAFQNGTHTSNPKLHFNNNFWQCPKQWSGNGAGNDNEPDTNAKESGNIRVTDNNWPAGAVSVMENAGIEPEYKDILVSKSEQKQRKK